MKRVLMLFVAGVLPFVLVGCALQTPLAVEPSSFLASTDGVNLAVSVTSVTPAWVDVAVNVSVSGADSIDISTPGGSIAVVRIIDAQTGSVVFDSAELDREAVQSNPGLEPEETEEYSDGSSRESTYQVKMGKGDYMLEARTFGPVVSIGSTKFGIR